jgi:D-alanine-D-alanine ligase
MNYPAQPFGHVGVLMGGYSSEREISLKSGNAVFQALKRQGCHVSALDITEKDEEKIKQAVARENWDIAFITLHGRLGEDGTIQSILEALDIPYTGSGVATSRLAINKVSTQDLLKKKNINISSYAVLSRDHERDALPVVEGIGSFPVVVKPACEGSSIGITIVRDPGGLNEALARAWQYGEFALVEKYIAGREVTVGILDGQALPVVEIRPKGSFFDFTAKYSQGMSDYIVPAQIPAEAALSLQKEALRAHHVLGCEDFSRVDFILGRDGAHYALEVNTIPGFTSTSLLPKAAQAAGIGFEQLCVRIIQLAYGKKKKIKNIFS